MDTSHHVAKAEIGWTVRLDHKFPLANQGQKMDTGGLDLDVPDYLKKINRKSLAIDFVDMVEYRPIYGVPIGGIGSGTIGRAFGGAFCRFQMIPGQYSYKTVEADQFILRVAKCKDSSAIWQQALCITGEEIAMENSSTLPTWHRFSHPECATYRALYPRSWTNYDLSKHCGVKAVCRQISPFIPGDYQDSCLPCAVFVWEIENTSGEDLDISLAFTFKNGIGDKEIDTNSKCLTETGELATKDGTRKIRCNKILQELNGMATTYSLAVLEVENVELSENLSFDPLASGADLWMQFLHKGFLSSESQCCVANEVKEIGTAIAASCWRVPVGGHRQIVFCLAWHQSTILFKSVHKRRYTRYCPDPDSLVIHALSTYQQWEDAIHQWQKPIVTDSSLPEWFRSAIFNELYYLADGGTIWVDVDSENIEKLAISKAHRQLLTDYGRFAYLEGHEYCMYNTYDVHFSASFALVQLWPALELTIQYDFARTVAHCDPRPFEYFFGNKKGVVKEAGCLAHDLGDPRDDPWTEVNAYFLGPTEKWKDLSLKFILQTWRDYLYAKNPDVLKDIYPICATLIKQALALWDQDGDGLIENSGDAGDNTYDDWCMTGPSSYCGGLWIAALRAGELMALELQLPKEEASAFAELQKRASAAYEKQLWNGKYYNFDCHEDESIRALIMANQLEGYWYLQMCDLANSSGPVSDILPANHVQSTMTSIFENNFLAISGGQFGVICGAKPNRGGAVDLCFQASEVWVGNNYSLAALFIANGRRSEGLAIAEAVYRTVYDKLGIGFQTPEAYQLDFQIRPFGYMRPLAIWSMIPSLNSVKKDEATSASAK